MAYVGCADRNKYERSRGLLISLIYVGGYYQTINSLSNLVVNHIRCRVATGWHGTQLTQSVVLVQQ